jgi:hypothetical protein
VKKPTFSAALAQGREQSIDPEPAPAKVRATDDRINTTIRISPEGLEALKVVAASKRTRVNDLLLEGAEHVLALNGRKIKLRK